MSGMNSANNFYDPGKDPQKYLARYFSHNSWCQVPVAKFTNLQFTAFEKTQVPQDWTQESHTKGLTGNATDIWFRSIANVVFLYAQGTDKHRCKRQVQFTSQLNKSWISLWRWSAFFINYVRNLEWHCFWQSVNCLNEIGWSEYQTGQKKIGSNIYSQRRK